jgi:hypothetical protein
MQIQPSSFLRGTSEALLDLHPLVRLKEVRHAAGVEEVVDVVEHEIPADLGVRKEEDAAFALLASI